MGTTNQLLNPLPLSVPEFNYNIAQPNQGEITYGPTYNYNNTTQGQTQTNAPTSSILNNVPNPFGSNNSLFSGLKSGVDKVGADYLGLGTGVAGDIGVQTAANAFSVGSQFGIGTSTANAASLFGGSTATGSGLGAEFGSVAGTAGNALNASTTIGSGLTADFGSGIGASAAAEAGGATLSGVLGAVGLGYAGGGFIASALGENPVGGSIGGAIGAGLGEAFGATGAAALGLQLGAFAGPIGAVAGGLLGAAVGGLFGNSKPSDKTQVGQLQLSNGIAQDQASGTGDEFSQDNANLRGTVENDSSKFAQYLMANGATAINGLTNPNDPHSGTGLIFEVGSRDGYRVDLQGAATGGAVQNLSNTQDPNQYLSNVQAAVLSQYNIPDSLKTQLDKMDIASQFFGATAASTGSAPQGGGFTGLTSTYTQPTVAAQKPDTQTFADFYKAYSGGKTLNK